MSDEPVKMFAELLKAEQELAEIKAQANNIANEWTVKVQNANYKHEAAKAVMQEYMESNGVTEEVFVGDSVDYKVCFTTPRETVDTPDVDALPDEFARIKKEPKKKELLEHIKSLPEHERPNWATLKLGEKSLTWRLVKKGKINLNKEEV